MTTFFGINLVFWNRIFLLPIVLFLIYAKLSVEKRLKKSFISERLVLKELRRALRFYKKDYLLIYDYSFQRYNLDFIIVSDYGLILIEVKSSKSKQYEKQLRFLKAALKKAILNKNRNLNIPVASGVIAGLNSKQIRNQIMELLHKAASGRKADNLLKEIAAQIISEMMVVGPRGFEPRTYGL